MELRCKFKVSNTLFTMYRDERRITYKVMDVSLLQQSEVK